MTSRPNQLIVHLSDQGHGGAAIAANRLAAGLAQLGAQVERWSCTPEILPNLAVPQVPLERFQKRPWLERLMRNLSRSAARHLRRRRHELSLYSEVDRRRPALLHLHNLHAGGLTHESLLRLPRELPLIWTLHDCFSFQPQAYEWASEGCQSQCIGEDPAGLRQAKANRARFFAARPDTVLIAPSQWIAERAKSAIPSQVRVEVIPNGLPRLKKVTQAAARTYLGLPRDRILLGFAAEVFDRRKGGDVFAGALREVSLPNYDVLVWGNDTKWTWPPGITWHRRGLVTDEQCLWQLYSACDLFVCPSRIDNFPNTVLESLACGTPVIGSQVGGIPELVRAGETGWLYTDNRPGACARALRKAFEERNDWAAYSERCRAFVGDQFGLEKSARRHLALYQELISGSQQLIY